MNLSLDSIRSVVSGRTWAIAAAAAAILGFTHAAVAVVLEAPSGTISTVSGGPPFTYAMTISDGANATQPIGTVWFAWVPGEDFLATSPLSETSPSGWQVNAITHSGTSDGYAIEWVATSAAHDIPIGGSLSGFGFTTADSPQSIQGNSPFFPGTPVLTTFAYDAGPFSDPGTEFTVAQAAAVPEPSTLAAALLPLATLVLRRPSRAA